MEFVFRKGKPFVMASYFTLFFLIVGGEWPLLTLEKTFVKIDHWNFLLHKQARYENISLKNLAAAKRKNESKKDQRRIE